MCRLDAPNRANNPNRGGCSHRGRRSRHANGGGRGGRARAARKQDDPQGDGRDAKDAGRDRRNHTTGGDARRRLLRRLGKSKGVRPGKLFGGAIDRVARQFGHAPPGNGAGSWRPCWRLGDVAHPDNLKILVFKERLVVYILSRIPRVKFVVNIGAVKGPMLILARIVTKRAVKRREALAHLVPIHFGDERGEEIGLEPLTPALPGGLDAFAIIGVCVTGRNIIGIVLRVSSLIPDDTTIRVKASLAVGVILKSALNLS